MPNILLWDLEASNLDADFGIILCAGAKTLGQKQVQVHSIGDFPLYNRNPADDRELLKKLHPILAGADMWVTYYGSRFDLPFITARLLAIGLPLLPPVPHVDLWETARRHLKIHSRRLGVVGEFLGLSTGKTPLSGPTWIRALSGHRPSLAYVEKHCRHDVQLLEEAYLKLRPLIAHHPRTSADLGRCRMCGSTHLQSRGRAISQVGGQKKRVQCVDCGAWDTRRIT